MKEFFMQYTPNMIDISEESLYELNETLISRAYDDRLLEPILPDSKRIFRISFEDRTGKLYVPDIPRHRAMCEDATIERVCFADTVEGCFRAIPGCAQFIDHGIYSNPSVARAHIYVHIPVFDKYFLRSIKEGFVAYPHTQLVPDSYITQEVWVMDSVTVKCVAEMYAWYDAKNNPNFTSLEELPVCLELINCDYEDPDLFVDSLFEHPEYTLPMYEL